MFPLKEIGSRTKRFLAFLHGDIFVLKFHVWIKALLLKKTCCDVSIESKTKRLKPYTSGGDSTLLRRRISLI